jgi:transglutaminase-like putative cysteine protease
MSAQSRKTTAVLVAYVLSFGIPLIARAYFRSQSALLIVLLPIAVTATSGILRRLWSPPRWWVNVLTAIPPIAFALLLLVGILITPYSSYAIWIENVQSGIPSGSVAMIFQLAFGFFASVLAPLVLTMGYIWPLLLIGTSLVALLTVVFQTGPFYALTVAMIAVTLLVLMARKSQRGHRVAAAVFYLGALAVCLVVGRLFAGSGAPRGSRLVDLKLYPLLRQIATDALPGLPLMYEIPGYGFSFSAKQLGGPTALSSRGIFSVEGSPGSSAYLRTVVYDYYDGQSWGISQPAFANTEDERRYLATAFYRRGRVASVSGDIGITIQTEYYSRLPTTIDTASLSFPGGIPIVEQGNMNTGILLKRPIKEGERFVIHRAADGVGPGGRVPPWTVPNLSPEMREAYTQVPEALPADVRELAEIINPDVTDKLQVLENVRQFLAIRASYNLRPEEEYMRTGDFVASFLLSQNPEGYCVHFATSLVILARLAGIPARYATGFLVYFPEDTGLTEVRGYSSHAWPEVWLDGVGWITFEATSAVDPAYYDLYGDALQSRLRINLNRSTAAQIEALLGRHVTSQDQVPAGGPFQLPAWLGIAGLVVLGAAVLAFLTLVASGRVHYLLLRDADRYRSQVRAMVRRFERQAIPHPRQVGWIRWWGILADRRPEHAEPIRATRDSMLRVVYWDGYFQRDHLRALTDFRKRYERSLANGRNGHARREVATSEAG